MRLLQKVLKLFGFHFVPDNHVVPILRGGLYRRVEGPGYTFVLPLLEEVKDPIRTSIMGATHSFNEVRTREGIPLTVKLTVRYHFDPSVLSENMARVLLTIGPQPKTIAILLADLVEHELRRLVGLYGLNDIWQSHVRDKIEKELGERVAGQMRRLGVFLRDQDAVIIKDITTLPEVTQALQAAKRHQILLDVLHAYEEADVDQALVAELVSGLADGNGHLSIMSLGQLFGLDVARGQMSAGGQPTLSDNGGGVLRFRRRGR